MIEFNTSKNHSNHLISLNKEIREGFINLDSSRKKLAIKQLSSNERFYLLNIIKNNFEFCFHEENQIQLNEKIKQAKNSTIEITRKNDALFQIWIKSIIVNLLSNIAYFFNFLTANKANKLIKDALLDSESKVDNKPELSSNALNKLLTKARKNLPPEEKVNLAELLDEKGLSKVITKQTFLSNCSLKDVDLDGITFVNCKFYWTPCSNSNLTRVTFKSCNIYNLSLMNSVMNDCVFDNCEMREVMFTAAALNNVKFKSSSIISSSFEDASLNQCVFKRSSLPATHFFEASVKDSKIIKSNLLDTVFFETAAQFKMDDLSNETAKVTRPTTAILINPEERGNGVPKAYTKLDQSSNTIPLRITMQAQKVTKKGVNEEVELALADIGPYDRDKLPIPQRLIKKLAKDPDSESAKILKKAEKLASQVDSLLLPGGEDVPPGLYGQEKGENTNWKDDYRRSILELGLIHQSFTKGIPLMAICRGFQITQVYFGAELVQHVDSHNGLQKFKLSIANKRGLYGEAIKNNIISLSWHHQGVLEAAPVTEHLETAVCYNGLVKAAEMNKSGATPMVLLQFHPEFYKAKTANSICEEIVDAGLNLIMSKENEAFWKILSDSARAYRTKKIALKLIRNKKLSSCLSYITPGCCQFSL